MDVDQIVISVKIKGLKKLILTIQLIKSTVMIVAKFKVTLDFVKFVKTFVK
jgi:hypothetical protein